MTSRQVLVLSGGLSPERDVSLRSGRRVADALRDVRPDWHVAEADVDAALLPYLQQNRPDCIVPLLHGAHCLTPSSHRALLSCLLASRCAADTTPRAAQINHGLPAHAKHLPDDEDGEPTGGGAQEKGGAAGQGLLVAHSRVLHLPMRLLRADVHADPIF